MSFAITVLSLCAAGLAVLSIARLSTRSWAVDGAMAWFVGCGWFSVIAEALRFVARVPYSASAAAAIVAAPVAVWFVARVWRRDVPARARGHGTARWLPRPAWLFCPVAAYVLFVLLVIVLHGVNTPTHTDDGVRVRAFAPVLAFSDRWEAPARALLSIAGAIPTFAPSFAWRVTGAVDPFHVNYFVLTGVVALVVACIALGATRGSPERGWASAFAIFSLPLFVYHCTSTYSDAVLAIHTGVGFLFAMEYAATRDARDAARAVLLFAFAAAVKREGWIVAGTAAAVLLAHVAWDARRHRRWPAGALALACLPFVIDVAARMAASGPAQALPFASLLASRAGIGSPFAPSTGAAAAADAWRVFAYALFHSGNAGVLYWVLPACVLALPRGAPGSRLVWPLVTVAALFAEAALSSVWLLPAYTLDQSTVHRALIPASVMAALWIAKLLADRAPRAAASEPAS